jgi:hypothetical protein
MIAVTITQGKAAKRTITLPEVRRAQEKPIRIFRRA